MWCLSQELNVNSTGVWEKRGSAQFFMHKAFIFSNLKVARVNSIKRDIPCKDPFFISEARNTLLILLTLDTIRGLKWVLSKLPTLSGHDSLCLLHHLYRALPNSGILDGATRGFHLGDKVMLNLNGLKFSCLSNN